MKNNVEGFTNRSKINEEAAQWVLLLEDTSKLSNKQIEELNNWVATSDIHRECIESMASSWGEMDLLAQVMVPQEIHKPSVFLTMLTKLLLPVIAMLSLLTVAMNQSKNLLRPIVLAPVLLCAIVFFSVINIQQANNPVNTVISTKVGESIHHQLPDGSSLWLNSSSKVQINYSENFRRINLFAGEAHFEVAKDPMRPFEVYADDRLVRAIGTAFTVHKLAERIEVLVSEGTVELAIIDNTLVVIPDDYKAIKIARNFEDKNLKSSSGLAIKDETNQPVTLKKKLGKLTAGQRISIPVKNDNLSAIDELDTSEVARFLSWKEGKLVFAGESLEEVIKEITRHTEVKIDVLDPQLKSMRIGGQFQVGETDTLFYVLESGFGISVNKLDANHVQLNIKKQIK
ncbi:FecR domain-containing protein [Psychrosphaera sp. B3R10]|uniref:FecR family protein n=1 Tax=unclassified Psychrosphaera TaxID=2641570 RepID=UPI001C092802|nr:MULTISPECIES: FecR domain-containing protein [unclassified Psychrosphaera]MBU2881492.1 FecR domain-containing protein [Psychrosphaera sp. I2R16]MBU2989496.1 FecR domain-containing protein [Psychrosphaera sp. B3R10]